MLVAGAVVCEAGVAVLVVGLTVRAADVRTL